MSNYLWTLRSQAVKAKDETGMTSDTIEMALFSFVSGNLDSWDGPTRHVKACAALAEFAWDKHAVDGRVPYVVVGDKADIAELRAGRGTYMTVYRGCKGQQWVDCNAFPADAVYGLLVKNGGRLAIRSAYVKENKEPNGSVMGVRASDGTCGPIPITGTRVDVIDGVAMETMRQYELPNGERVWASMKDKEAFQCIADDWAPAWKAKKEAEAKEAERVQKTQQIQKLQKETQELMKKGAELQNQLAEVKSQIQQKRREVDSLAALVARAA
jgi:hypothetical protein